MSQTPAPVRVKGGPPWWLCVMLALATVVIISGVLLSSKPDDPAKLFADATTQFENQDGAGFKDSLARLRKFDDYQVHVKLLEGMLAYSEVRDVRAIKLFAEIPDDHELKSLALQKSGDAFRRTNRFHEAVAAYEESISRAPDSSMGSRVSLAELYFAVGAYGLAERALNEAVKRDPENKGALATRALVRSEQLRYDDALSDFREVLATPGDFSAATPRVLQTYLQCVIKTNQTELIEELLNDHMSLLDQDEDRMSLLVAGGKPEEALVMYAELSKEDHGGYTAFRKPAVQAAVAMKDWKQASSLFDGVIGFLPRDIELFEAAVKFYAGLERADELALAEQNLEQLRDLESELLVAMKKVEDDIENVEGRVEVAKLFMELGRFERGRNWYAVAAMMDDSYSGEAKLALHGEFLPRKPLIEFEAKVEQPAPDSEGDKSEGDKSEADKPEDSDKSSAKAPTDSEDQAKQDDDDAASKPNANDAEGTSKSADGESPPDAQAKEAPKEDS